MRFAKTNDNAQKAENKVLPMFKFRLTNVDR